MEKEKLIIEIDLALESIRAHIKRIKNDSNNVHKMDIDLLIEKTRNIYDKLIRLDGLTIPFETEISLTDELEIEETKTVETETVETKIEEIVKEEAKAEKEAEITEEDAKVEAKAKDKITEEKIKVETEIEAKYKVEEVKEQIEEEQNKDDLIEEKEEILIDIQLDEVREIIEIEEDKEEKEETEKSTIDLFTSSAGPTLSDTFSEAEHPTIADKITTEGINELREAIGINEKFLFINELFNGDMGRYNKVIDELDELATLEGVNTYLLELKIQSQWVDDNAALIKLSDMLNKKFVK